MFKIPRRVQDGKPVLCVVKQMETLMMNQKQREEAVKEATVLKRMVGHSNIVRFHEVFMTRKGRLCIVMDYYVVRINMCGNAELVGRVHV